jgi:hypothetical protein
LLVFVALLVLLLTGCQSPCLLCSPPDAVVASMKGQVGNLRVIEKELVDQLEDAKLKELWKLRMAAFITESRGTLAWATREDFDARSVLEEERKE